MVKSVHKEVEDLFYTAKFLWDNQLAGAIQPEKKNYFQYSEGRVYNAIARIFGSILEPCGSAIIKNNTLYISYNGDKHKLLAKHKAEIDKLRDEIKKLNADSDVSNILGMLLWFQFKNDTAFKWIFKELEKKITVKDFKAAVTAKDVDYSTLSNSYFKLLHTLVKDDIKLEGDKIKLIRPLQDVHKLKYELSKTLKIDEIEIHSHLDDLHAEVALFLSQLENEQLTQEQFLGISKYCCFICEELLNHYSIPHSGAHNIFAEQKDILNPDKIFSTAKHKESYGAFLVRLQNILINYLKTDADQNLQKITNGDYIKGKFKEEFSNFYNSIWKPFLEQLDDALTRNCKINEDSLPHGISFINKNQARKFDTQILDMSKKKDVLTIPKQEFDLSDDEDIEMNIDVIKDFTLFQLKNHLKEIIQLEEQNKNKENDEEYKENKIISQIKEKQKLNVLKEDEYNQLLNNAYLDNNYWKKNPENLVGTVEELLSEYE